MDLVFQHTALSIYDALTSILVFNKMHSNNLLLDEALHHPLLVVGTIIHGPKCKYIFDRINL